MVQTISNKIMVDTTNTRIQAAINEAEHYRTRLARDPNPANRKLFETARAVVSEVIYFEETIAELSRLSDAGRALVFEVVSSVLAGQKTGTITEQHSPNFDAAIGLILERRRDADKEPWVPVRQKGFGDRASGDIDYSKYARTDAPGGFGARGHVDSEHSNIEMPPGAYHNVVSHVKTEQPYRLHAFGVEDTLDAIKSGAKKVFGGLRNYGHKFATYIAPHVGNAINKLADYASNRAAPALGGGAALTGAALAVGGAMTGHPGMSTAGVGMMGLGGIMMKHGTHGIRDRVIARHNASVRAKEAQKAATAPKPRVEPTIGHLDSIRVRKEPALGDIDSLNVGHKAHISNFDDVVHYGSMHHFPEPAPAVRSDNVSKPKSATVTPPAATVRDTPEQAARIAMLGAKGRAQIAKARGKRVKDRNANTLVKVDVELDAKANRRARLHGPGEAPDKRLHDDPDAPDVTVNHTNAWKPKR